MNVSNPFKNHPYQSAFVAAALTAVSLIFFGTHLVRESRVFFVSVFDGLVRLPNDFVLEARGKKNPAFSELSFAGNQGRVVVGHNLASRKDFLEYVEKNRAATEKSCGLQIERVQDRKTNATMVVVHDDSDYLVFAGVEPKTVDRALATLCDTQGRRR